MKQKLSYYSRLIYNLIIFYVKKKGDQSHNIYQFIQYIQVKTNIWKEMKEVSIIFYIFIIDTNKNDI